MKFLIANLGITAGLPGKKRHASLRPQNVQDALGFKTGILIPSVLTLVFLLASCGQDKPGLPARGNDPWAFRSVLDGRPRILTLALADRFWAAYSAQDGAIYKVWRGDVNFDGAVYTTVHGPQPSSLGDAFFVNEAASPWTARLGGQSHQPAVRYRGHRFREGQAYINYTLHLENGATVHISERPEYLERAEGKQQGFERTFFVEGLPAGAELFFDFNLSSLPSAHTLETDGELDILETTPARGKGLNAVNLKGRLKLNNPGTTRLAAYFTKYPMVHNPNRVEGSEEEDALPRGARLIARSDCKTCHNTYLSTIGPAYADVAKRYPNTPDNVAMLVAKVQNGGAGVWGEADMTPHPDLDEMDVRAMVEYIMGLDAEEEAMEARPVAVSLAGLDFADAAEGVRQEDLLPGLLLRIYQSGRELSRLADLNFSGPPLYEGIAGQVYIENSEFQGLEANFGMRYNGYIAIPKDNNYVFRLRSDDGSRLLIGGQEVVNYDGLHGADKMDGEVALRKGLHAFQLDYFQGGGGKFIALEWSSYDNPAFALVPPGQFFRAPADQPAPDARTPPMAQRVRIPGDRYPVAGVHPGYTLSPARPADFMPKVGGMDFLSDGRLVVSTWDAEGAVYIVDGVKTGDPARMSYKKIASGLAEPLGLKVVEDTIYVLQKQELTQLIDHDGDELIDEYYTVSNDWKVSGNFHEFAFGLAYKEGFFYAALAIAILPGGASANPQIPDRGKAVRISRRDGALEFVAQGLRTPNGVGFGIDGELFIADNQGDWLPSCKILHVTPGDFFGSRAVDSAQVARLPVKPPVVWLPQDEIGNSPTTPAALKDGPYRGQMIHGEVTHGGVKRVFVEKVKGEYQGCVFRFIQGLEAGVNRLAWGPDSALYIGGIGSTGNWQHTGHNWYGLQRLKYNGQSVFEMLAVRAKSNGLEITFTEPLEPGAGWDPAAYTVQQWWYLPTSAYGGPKKDLQTLAVRSASVSEDRRRVFLELPGMQAGHVLYLRLPGNWISAAGRELWSTEAWYTMNNIPEGLPGLVAVPPAPLPPNTLSGAEKAAGWRLLFDGKTTAGWHGWKKKTAGASWIIEDGALKLNAVRQPDGSLRPEDGGDLLTDEEFDNYELRLEWKISPCGNSGIMFNVVEAEQYDYPWQTGPEMQILDNVCHPDAAFETHRAGCLFDMVPVKYETVKPAGAWNQVRIIIRDGKSQFWLNGRRVVDFDMFGNDWQRLIRNSKFKDMPDFGKARKGRICLQDHTDAVVSFRNIKIRELE
ncbi:MAG: DUF1080 domain-containing protein [Phaeodactylibacter sp.]|nr:DUF1080 domain-containing protein [Phaeodactylibacter sp.]